MSTRTNVLGMAVAALALSASANAAILWQAPIQTDTVYAGFQSWTGWTSMTQASLPASAGLPPTLGTYVATEPVTGSDTNNPMDNVSAALPTDNATPGIFSVHYEYGRDVAAVGREFVRLALRFKDAGGTVVGGEFGQDRAYYDGMTTGGWRTLDFNLDITSIPTAASLSQVTVQYFNEGTGGVQDLSPKNLYLNDLRISYTPVAIPEPVSMGLVGLTALGLLRRQRKA